MRNINLFLVAFFLIASNIAFSQEKSSKKHEKTAKNHKKSSKGKKPAPKPSAIELTNKIDSVSYGLGVLIGGNLRNQGFDTISTNALAKGLADIMKKEAKINEKNAESIVMEYSRNLQTMKAQKNLIEGQKFLEENKNKPGVVTLPSGLQYMILKEGTGPKPTASDMVTTHYHGTLIDGTVFDSSVERGQPASFRVTGVIQGWVEALQLMPVGSKWRLFIPSNLAYGEQGSRGAIGPNSALIFDVELISIGN